MITIMNLDQVKELILKQLGLVNPEGVVSNRVAEKSGVAFVYVDNQWQIAINTLGPVPEGLSFSHDSDDEGEGDDTNESSTKVDQQNKSVEPGSAPKRKRKRRTKEQIAAEEAEKAKEESQPEPAQEEVKEPVAEPVDDEPPFKVDEPVAENTAEPVPQDDGNPFAQAAAEVVEEPKVAESVADVFGNSGVAPTPVENQPKSEPVSTTADQDNPFANFK